MMVRTQLLLSTCIQKSKAYPKRFRGKILFRKTYIEHFGMCQAAVHPYWKPIIATELQYLVFAVNNDALCFGTKKGTTQNFMWNFKADAILFGFTQIVGINTVV